jgi:hypothetical protein
MVVGMGQFVCGRSDGTSLALPLLLQKQLLY